MSYRMSDDAPFYALMIVVIVLAIAGIGILALVLL